MLTKQEREEITERLKGINFFTDNEIYKAITGKCVSVTTTYNEDIKRMIKAILGLCDTSNMVELPLDKYGEVIHVGDTVYNEAGDMLEVKSVEYSYCERVYINAFYVGTKIDGTFFTNELTHKATTIEENVKEFNEAVKTTAQFFERSMNQCVEAMKKLAEVFNRLGDSDD